MNCISRKAQCFKKSHIEEDSLIAKPLKKETKGEGKDKAETMIYRYLGPTGLQVSVLGFSAYITEDTKASQKLTTDAVQRAPECGINYFDTSEC